MKRKGFTLIELLAVVVVLAIIALIAAPIIIKVIERAEKGSFKDSAYGVVDAARIYYADKSFDGKEIEEIFNYPEDTKLKLSGSKPKSGRAYLNKEGKVGIAISNGKWCAKKGIDEEKVSIVDYTIDDCKIKGLASPEGCFTVNASGNTITGYTCTDPEVIIPKEIKGVTITSIGANAFKNKNLEKVELPDTITTIGGSAFASNHLTEIEIPEGVTTISSSAFLSNKLVSVSLPSILTTLGANSFQNNRLTSVTVPGSVGVVGNYAFQGNQLINVELESGITSIGTYAFQNNQITSINIPSTITNIGNYAFENNKITTLGLESGITNIGGSAFKNNLIIDVTIPGTVNEIGASVFENNKLTNLTIQTGVKTIGVFAFRNNELPDNKAFIYGRNADGTENRNVVIGYGGARKQNVSVPSGVTSIENRAFTESNLESVSLPSTLTSIATYAFSGNKLTSVSIANGLTSIGGYAFQNNQLLGIIVPESVTTIGSNAFYGNKSGMKVTVDKLKNTISGSPWGASSVEWKPYKVYTNGNAVYYNPNTNTKCTAGEAVSTTGTKSGCMKWYTFLDGGGESDTINLLLDHNTTARKWWSSSQGVLNTDTSGWKVTARFITADEIAKITGADKALQWSSSKPYISGTPTIGANISTYYFDGAYGTSNVWKNTTGVTTYKYAWLYDNLYDCLRMGCTNQDNKYYANSYNSAATGPMDSYRTSTLAVGHNNVSWAVSSGKLDDVALDSDSGIRPVITIPKSIFN